MNDQSSPPAQPTLESLLRRAERVLKNPDTSLSFEECYRATYLYCLMGQVTDRLALLAGINSLVSQHVLDAAQDVKAVAATPSRDQIREAWLRVRGDVSRVSDVNKYLFRFPLMETEFPIQVAKAVWEREGLEADVASHADANPGPHALEAVA